MRRKLRQRDRQRERHFSKTIGRQIDKYTDESVRRADGLTEGINVYLMVHCSVVVSPFHPAKWLLINQPDLSLSYSADRLLVSWRWRVAIDPVRMTKDTTRNY